MPKKANSRKKKKSVFNKKDLKKRPIRVVYPYLCPFCDELAYPESESSFKPLRLPDETTYRYVCMAGHTFYVYERIVNKQDWADSRCNDEKWRERSRYWKKQLKDNQYGVEDLKN